MRQTWTRHGGFRTDARGDARARADTPCSQHASTHERVHARWRAPLLVELVSVALGQCAAWVPRPPLCECGCVRACAR
eukprot:4241805-Pleurochrysis_carterae.AAC.1